MESTCRRKWSWAGSISWGCCSHAYCSSEAFDKHGFSSFLCSPISFVCLCLALWCSGCWNILLTPYRVCYPYPNTKIIRQVHIYILSRIYIHTAIYLRADLTIFPFGSLAFFFFFFFFFFFLFFLTWNHSVNADPPLAPWRMPWIWIAERWWLAEGGKLMARDAWLGALISVPLAPMGQAMEDHICAKTWRPLLCPRLLLQASE